MKQLIMALVVGLLTPQVKAGFWEWVSGKEYHVPYNSYKKITFTPAPKTSKTIFTLGQEGGFALAWIIKSQSGTRHVIMSRYSFDRRAEQVETLKKELKGLEGEFFERHCLCCFVPSSSRKHHIWTDDAYEEHCRALKAVAWGSTLFVKEYGRGDDMEFDEFRVDFNELEIQVSAKNCGRVDRQVVLS